jgi:sRNA-binding carbon storage regulator CsrA
MQIIIGHTPVKVLIDSGTSVNIIHNELFKHIKNENNRIKLINH